MMERLGLGFGRAPLRQRLRCLPGMIRVLRDPGQIGLHRIAEHGERDRRLALKERSAQFAFQCDDPVGQRGLGNAAAPGRAGKIALLAQGQEVADLVHLHVFTLVRMNRAHTRDLVMGGAFGR